MKTNIKQIKQTLDVALLKPTATTTEIETLAKALREEGFRYFCVNSNHTVTAVQALKGSNVQVVTCVGFPHGTVKTATKVFETEAAVAEGAGEIDMVLDLGALLGGNLKQAEADVRAVVKAAQGSPVKVIIETPHPALHHHRGHRGHARQHADDVRHPRRRPPRYHRPQDARRKRCMSMRQSGITQIPEHRASHSRQSPTRWPRSCPEIPSRSRRVHTTPAWARSFRSRSRKE